MRKVLEKLLWSAFAVSLWLNPDMAPCQSEMDDFLGLETEVMPELKGEQKFSPPELHQSTVWKVAGQELDKEPLKGQNHSLIRWKDREAEEWLDIDRWLVEREIKDKTPDWKIRVRSNMQSELVGKILQCRGKCLVYRGNNPVETQHLSRIVEGDELRTEENSVAWIFLIDGTLARVPPKSSISFQEINLSQNEIFFLTRLNHGHVFWHPRNSEALEPDLAPETDAYSLPLLVREANQEFFERKIYQSQADKERLNELMDLNETAVVRQYEQLNNLKKINNGIGLVSSRLMMVTPNATIVSSHTTLDVFYYSGGEAIFRKKNASGKTEFQLRGYSDTAFTSLEAGIWQSVSSNGRTARVLEDVPSEVMITELLTKRIKTMELAREHWIEKYTKPVMGALNNPSLLAARHGYNLWGEELSKRFDYLVEYSRRVETTHLRSIENLMNKLASSGKTEVIVPSEELYQSALKHYLSNLKIRYTSKKMQVREMNDVQYYVWILKNGKL